MFAFREALWLLILVPVVTVVGIWIWRRRVRAAAAWTARDLWARLFPAQAGPRRALSLTWLCLAVAGTTLALAQPRWGVVEQKIERRGVDVVFVLDTSLSMATGDLQPNRLWVAQTLVRRLVQALPGHRVALVQAEGDGVVMAPLTVDAAVIDLLLDAVQPGSLPVPGTLLAPALERAIGLFPEAADKHNVIVLLSDGEDHGSGIDAVITKLKERGVILHAIGVGTVEGRPLELPSFDPNQAIEYKKDEKGQVVVSRLHEETLQKLAQETGGQYLRASSAATAGDVITRQIAAMDQKSFGSETIDTLEERFQWPLGLAIGALLLHLLIAPFRGESP